MKVIIIAAVANNGVIGKANGEMSWHVKDEFHHFKQTTLGSPIIMGRKTFETLGKPLKGRENIIVTRNENLSFAFEDIKIFHSLKESLSYCRKKKYEKAFIIGGGEIYRQALPLADELILSFMKFEAEGDVVFPEIRTDTWQQASSEEREQFKILRYVRKHVKAN